ncbi:DNA cytosine methyltransferase [Novosphingobium colocasiae]|uniref:Cytosine-specific methyltransferase n=1 Tax=Novosphingobium colocasiae TaxID=1256513 RepID=A0A918PNA2_9SPHN|nr:DNA cytosine methyltransferase [Novosphingobium colocasiae]GGZ16696.1 cytosine-specific methyltransferase [Novosphingobium colocasiae]
MKWKLIDLFSGAGGMSLGFADDRFCGGFDPILAIDNDRAAIETHKANFSGDAVCGNIEDWLDRTEVPAADIVIGGPPCQGFSLLNKKRDGDSRRALWEPYLDIVRRSGARMFIMENVAELFRSPELVAIRKKAEKIGFKTDAAILNTADYGAPQTRRRTIVIGWRKGVWAPQFPPLPTHADPGTKTNRRPWVTVREVIGDLPEPVEIEIQGEAPLNLHIRRTPTEKSMARYRAVPPGGNRFDLLRNAPEITPDCWVRKTSGGTDLFGRLWWDRPSVTIRTEFYKPEKGRYLHPDQHRPITHREAARLMGFPDDFRFCGTKVEIARQIGNAVPPPFAGSLARMAADVLMPAKMTA